MSETNVQKLDREIVTTRVFDAPVELVFEAWTKPELLAKWWGPRGFSITTHQHDFRAGGSWKLTMHGPDGKDYPNHHVYEEIVPNERIVHRHTGGVDGVKVDFKMTVSFERLPESRTRITMRHLFATAEMLETVAKKYGAVEGAKETLARLAEHVAWSASSANKVVKQESRAIKIERVFDAPRSLVWEAWSKPEHMAKWWGPRGFTLTIDEMDLRTGGSFRMAMHGPDGAKYPFSGRYEEVVPAEKIVFGGEVHDGVTQRAVVTFADEGKKTKVVVEQTYSAESPATRGAVAGWSQQHDKLAEYLAKLA